jgi:4-phosphopantoate--beta-alanine ligase
VPIVDDVVRAVPNVTAHARDLQEGDGDASREELTRITREFDPEAALRDAETTIREGFGREAEADPDADADADQR